MTNKVQNILKINEKLELERELNLLVKTTLGLEQELESLIIRNSFGLE